MECKDLPGLFSDYYDGALSAFKRETVIKHLLSCKRCSLKYKTYCEALAYIKTVPDERLPEEFYTGLDRKLEEAGKPFFMKLQAFLTMKNVSVGVLGVIFGLIVGVYINYSLIIKTPPLGDVVQTSSGKAEKEKNTGRIIMRTGNAYKASYDLDRFVNGFDNAGLEAVTAGAGSKQEPIMRVLHKKYIITVNAGQYENLVKQLNGLGYIMKLPDKKELAAIKKLKAADQIKFELDITEDGK
ncbi:MAG: zf-HC2 domain-containing protein [Candidatus Firestonebacteria bacterium]